MAADALGGLAVKAAEGVIMGQVISRGNAAVDKWLSKDKPIPEAPKSGIFKNKAGRK